MTIPKIFISYCWSTPDHEQWVIDLATELTESGVEVIIDKWDLREGHDAVAFMERMVTDPTISKVVIVCDKVYAEKADERQGGVGTETQIISREVYERTSQDKFVAVIAERDETGKPFLPTYYKSRMYIDLSESDRYAERFEGLVRWIFDRPRHVKPERGKPPEYITEDSPTTLGTSALAKRAVDGIKNDKGYARGAMDEYLTTFSANIDRLRLNEKGGELDEMIVGAIEAFSPFRNEFIQVLGTFVQYSQPGSTAVAVHRFLESLLVYYSRPMTQSSSDEHEFDQFKFIVHELFLYSLAVYLRAADYGAANHLLTEPYYLLENAPRGDAAASFTVFRESLESLAYRNRRLELRRLSLRADLLKQRSKTSGIPFQTVMQADFICFMRAALSGSGVHGRWWPETLLYAKNHYGPFEVFARAASKARLPRLLALLGVAETEPIKAKLEQFATDPHLLPRWQHESFNPATLMGFDQLGTRA